MEEEKKKNELERKDIEIIYSKAIKSGKRIYYLDVKKNQTEELFLAITESKKIVTGAAENMRVSYEKHKIFLYQEDFNRFVSGLKDVIGFIEHQRNKEASVSDNSAESSASTESKSKSFFDKFKF